MNRMQFLRILQWIILTWSACAGDVGAENAKTRESPWKDYRLRLFKTGNGDHPVKGATVRYKDQFGRDKTVSTDSSGYTPKMTSMPEGGLTFMVTVNSKYDGWYDNPVPLMLPLLPGWNYYHYETKDLSHLETEGGSTGEERTSDDF